jgi:hypothetical protein
MKTTKVEQTDKTRTFAIYVALNGYRPVRVWENDHSLYAQIKGQCCDPKPKFTQVLQGGTVIRLSKKDLNNKEIVGNYKF